MTILFIDDWKDHKGAIIDTETRNKSFLRLAALYRDMGIRNHSFILALHNPELQGIDPFDPTLSMDQMMSIALESKNNIWYYLREVARVPGSGMDKQYVNANRGNIAAFWLFMNHITTLLVQPRQTGKSFSIDILMGYIMNIASTETYIAMLTKDETIRSRSLSRLKGVIEELPYYLNQKTKKDVANTEEITIKRLGNRYKAMLPNKSPKAALNVGRGLTAPIFHVDELAFLYNIGITLPAALPAVVAARSIAKRKGEPYGTLFTTTAGKKDDDDGKYAYELMTGASTWTEKYYDTRNPAELESVIRANSPAGDLLVNCTFNHRQLGHTDEWLREQLEITRSRGEDADRDYFNIWTSGTQNSPFSSDTADRIRASEVADSAVEIHRPYNYVTRWYVPLEIKDQRMASSNYILGVDTSDAIGKDDIAMILIDIKTGEVMSAASINETNIITYARWLASIIVAYPTITVIIERRSTGAAIIDMLVLILLENNINPFKRLYNRVVQDKDMNSDRFTDMDKRYNYSSIEYINRYKDTIGFATSGSGVGSRSELYSTTLTNCVKTTSDVIRDRSLINQLLSLTIRNGRVDHGVGDHDDLVIAWLLTGWLLTEGKNLSYYGIDSKNILSSNRIVREQHSTMDTFDQARQLQLQTEVTMLLEKIENERDPNISLKLEARLRRLMPEINSRDAIYAIDQLLQDMKDKKRLSRKLRNSNPYTHDYR